MTNWIKKIQLYCEKYDIPIGYLQEIISEPKVIPMIRGKAFEFSVFLRLKQMLSADWIVEKPILNPQLGNHDIDIKLIHENTGKTISVECKLAAKGSFRQYQDGNCRLRVKCMRSRTLGENQVKRLAPKLDIDEKLLAIHNDQYLPNDFDIVITSIANGFYITDKETDLFEWQPNNKAKIFLQHCFPDASDTELQHLTYNTMLFAFSKNLAIYPENNISCTRKACFTKENCGFIPNYPIIRYSPNMTMPQSPWYTLSELEKQLNSYIAKT